MKFRKSKLLLVLAALAVPQFSSEVRAELKECNGVWTNGDCEGGAAKTLKDHVPVAPDDPALSEKRSMIHELTMKTIRAREDFDLRFDIKGVEQFCLKTPSSADDCREKIASAEKDLDKRVSRESKIQTEAKRLKLEEEKEKIAKTEREANATSVTVFQNVIRVPPNYRPTPYPPRPGYIIDKDGFTHPITRPDPRYNNPNGPGATGSVINQQGGVFSGGNGYSGTGSYSGSGSGVSVGVGGYRRGGRRGGSDNTQ